MKLSILVAAIALFFSTLVHANRRRHHKKRRTSNNFLATCKNLSLQGNTLNGTCQKMDQSWILTSLNLDECLANINGNFQWQQSGAYSQSSNNCNLNASNGIITCSARKMDGSMNTTTFNLNNSVSNLDGFLSCDNLKSTRIGGRNPNPTPTPTPTPTPPPTPNNKGGAQCDPKILKYAEFPKL